MSQPKPFVNHHQNMNLELTHDITMVGACINVANDKNYLTVWKGQPPADFETDLTGLGADYEAILQKDALGRPVRMFCVPGDNTCYPASLAVAREAGYQAIMTIYDQVNHQDTDLFRLGR